MSSAQYCAKSLCQAGRKFCSVAPRGAPASEKQKPLCNLRLVMFEVRVRLCHCVNSAQTKPQDHPRIFNLQCISRFNQCHCFNSWERGFPYSTLPTAGIWPVSFDLDMVPAVYTVGIASEDMILSCKAARFSFALHEGGRNSKYRGATSDSLGL